MGGVLLVCPTASLSRGSSSAIRVQETRGHVLPGSRSSARTPRRRGHAKGAGVHYWASSLEWKLCAGQEVALVGAGNSAGQAAVYLASVVAKVWLLPRGRSLEASMSQYLVDRIAGLPNVEVLLQTEVFALEGHGRVGR